MLAYLSMMAPRLVELRRALKPTGSIYLHCDPTASHYLKLLLDAIFGPEHFRNEIIWERTTGRKGVSQFGRVHDVILLYSKTETMTWNAPTLPQSEENVRGHDLMADEAGMYRLSDLTGAGQGPARKFADHGEINPPAGRHWQYDQSGIERLLNEGRIAFSKGGRPRLKTYVKDLPGVSIRDVWTDIEPINAAAAERLGYPTQKPEALLERIIQASSSEGDVVLDPFCGCGTAVAVAQRLNRRWIGIDITHLAVNLIKVRLRDAFGPKVEKAYRVLGEPTTNADAAQLAKDDPWQFQWWALGLVGARPATGSSEKKKGADRGIDGRLFFHDESEAGDVKQVILSVKAGENLNVSMVRDLVGVLDREKTQGAAIGVLISMEDPTKPMREEAAGAGFYRSPAGTQHPRIQLLTVAQLLQSKTIDMPPWHDVRTFKKAPKSKTKTTGQGRLGFEGE